MERSYTPSKEESFLISEYGSKRNIFFPSKPSPNLFFNKLEFRMQKYYSQCIKYNALKRRKKKCIK